MVGTLTSLPREANPLRRPGRTFSVRDVGVRRMRERSRLALLATALVGSRHWRRACAQRRHARRDGRSGVRHQPHGRRGQPVTNLPAGTYTITVHDLSDIHDFHLAGRA